MFMQCVFFFVFRIVVVRCLFVVGTLFSEINVHVENGCAERKPCEREKFNVLHLSWNSGGSSANERKCQKEGKSCTS